MFILGVILITVSPILRFYKSYSKRIQQVLDVNTTDSHVLRRIFSANEASELGNVGCHIVMNVWIKKMNIEFTSNINTHFIFIDYKLYLITI